MFLQQMCAELGGRGKTRNLKKHPLEASSQSRKQILELGKKKKERKEREKRNILGGRKKKLFYTETLCEGIWFNSFSSEYLRLQREWPLPGVRLMRLSQQHTPAPRKRHIYVQEG